MKWNLYANGVKWNREREKEIYVLNISNYISMSYYKYSTFDHWVFVSCIVIVLFGYGLKMRDCQYVVVGVYMHMCRFLFVCTSSNFLPSCITSSFTDRSTTSFLMWVIPSRALVVGAHAFVEEESPCLLDNELPHSGYAGCIAQMLYRVIVYILFYYSNRILDNNKTDTT